MNHRIGMTFDMFTGEWRVTQCYEGNGPVPLVRAYKDGSKELFLSYPRPLPVGWVCRPTILLRDWQHRPRRKRMQAETRAHQVRHGDRRGAFDHTAPKPVMRSAQNRRAP